MVRKARSGSAAGAPPRRLSPSTPHAQRNTQRALLDEQLRRRQQQLADFETRKFETLQTIRREGGLPPPPEKDELPGTPVSTPRIEPGRRYVSCNRRVTVV